MATEVTQRIAPREVTDEEAAFFKEHNWVYLEQLIPEDDALTLLGRLKEKMGEDARTTRAGYVPSDEVFKNAAKLGAGDPLFNIWGPLAVDCGSGDIVDDVFFQFSHSPELGRLARKLFGHQVRYWEDQSLVKVRESAPTMWHQDSGADDRSVFAPKSVQHGLWMALDHCSPEQGTMRFVNSSDATEEFHRIVQERPLEESFTALEELGIISPPFDMRPGDATVHGSQVYHAAPPNTTDRPRWSYLCSMFRADATWTGRDHWPLQGVQGLEVGKPFPDHRFRVIPE